MDLFPRDFRSFADNYFTGSLYNAQDIEEHFAVWTRLSESTQAEIHEMALNLARVGSIRADAVSGRLIALGEEYNGRLEVLRQPISLRFRWQRDPTKTLRKNPRHREELAEEDSEAEEREVTVESDELHGMYAALDALFDLSIKRDRAFACDPRRETEHVRFAFRDDGERADDFPRVAGSLSQYMTPTQDFDFVLGWEPKFVPPDYPHTLRTEKETYGFFSSSLFLRGWETIMNLFQGEKPGFVPDPEQRLPRAR